jgi:hypothetical protein
MIFHIQLNSMHIAMWQLTSLNLGRTTNDGFRSIYD